MTTEKFFWQKKATGRSPFLFGKPVMKSWCHHLFFKSVGCVIGEVRPEPQGIVVMRTAFGGTRIVDMLVGDQLPRIC